MTTRGRPPIGPQLRVRLTPETHAEIKAAAAAEGVPVAEVVREMVVRSLGMVYDDTIGTAVDPPGDFTLRSSVHSRMGAMTHGDFHIHGGGDDSGEIVMECRCGWQFDLSGGFYLDQLQQRANDHVAAEAVYRPLPVH